MKYGYALRYFKKTSEVHCVVTLVIVGIDMNYIEIYCIILVLYVSKILIPVPQI